MGALGNPKKGNHDEEKKETPRRIPIPAFWTRPPAVFLKVWIGFWRARTIRVGLY